LRDFRQTRIALLRADTNAEVFQIIDEIVEKWGECFVIMIQIKTEKMQQDGASAFTGLSIEPYPTKLYNHCAKYF
jgi:hypothetical protein